MISEIILTIMIFALGFCFGALFELKGTEKLNESWYELAMKINKDWSEYCDTLIEKIKTLEQGDKE